jgi:hypothetical protein
MRAAESLPFAFDPIEHEYIDTASGDVLPHITGMLNVTGHMDDRWFTEESSARGTRVHDLTAKYDLGALELDEVSIDHPGYAERAYLLAHAEVMRMTPHDYVEIEVARVHPRYRYGGRPDRFGTVRGLTAILEIKSGDYAKGHQIQTALQAILVATDANLYADMIARFCLYLRPNGKGTLEQHKDRSDFDRAYEVIKRCCG